MTDVSAQGSAVASEHQRLIRQLEMVTWESGYWRGAHKRLRTAIEAAIKLIRKLPETDSERITIFAVERYLTEVLALDDCCLLARPPGTRPQVLLAGHLDTVPAQDNLPGRRDAERVHGLGASDMKALQNSLTDFSFIRAAKRPSDRPSSPVARAANRPAAPLMKAVRRQRRRSPDRRPSPHTTNSTTHGPEPALRSARRRSR